MGKNKRYLKPKKAFEVPRLAYIPPRFSGKVPRKNASDTEWEVFYIKHPHLDPRKEEEQTPISQHTVNFHYNKVYVPEALVILDKMSADGYLRKNKYEKLKGMCLGPMQAVAEQIIPTIYFKYRKWLKTHKKDEEDENGL